MSDSTQQLIQQAHLARRENRLPDARRDFTEAVACSRSSGNRGELIPALKGLGQIERDLGNQEEARRLYEEAVSLSRKEGDGIQLAHTIRHLGDVHQHEGHMELAECCYQEALALYRSESQTSPLDLANAVRPLALLKERTNDIGAAITLWTEARDLYAATAVQAGFSECSRHLSKWNR
jgi:tetratricopeptide (TPR) repeat protein